MKLHNTLTGQVETFTPQSPDTVTLYTCGPTVYSEPHIGNWVANIRWDTLVRVLQMNGYNVDRVMNITDVGHLTGENDGDADQGEDKMQKGARREGISEWDIAAKYTDAFLKGMKELNLLEPRYLVKATDHIASQIALIQTLEQKGHTYIISDGVYFDTSTFPTYAEFARLDLAGLKAGARVTFNDEKRNHSDFALWKFVPDGETYTMQWESPWGIGFPGWHIECSAMAMQYLGATLDIHTGGIDHIPVHHTNEIAQSEAASGQKFSNFWVHANFLTSDGRKISKSLENGYTLGDITSKGFSATDFKLFVLQSHYSNESNFSWENLAAAHQRFVHWCDVAYIRWQIHDTIVDDEDKSIHDSSLNVKKALHDATVALNNDLNTPQALMHIEEALSIIETSYEHIQQDVVADVFDFIDNVLGLPILSLTPDINDDVKRLLLQRRRARDNQDWKQSDELREELSTLGVTVKDSRNTQVWTRNQS